MKNRLILSICFFLFMFHLYGDEFEGIPMFSSYDEIDLEWLPQFLPYNPVIVEAGAFFGDETCRAAKIWPEGRIYAFEPNPYAFEVLKKNLADANISHVEISPLALSNFNGTANFYICKGMEGEDGVFGYASSMLRLTREMEIYCKGPQIKVPCVILDDWCKENQIDQIDLLRLEVEGVELQVLHSSPEILKNTKVIYVKTFIHPHRIGMTKYQDLKRFLDRSNFVLLAHWYETGIIGHAIFLSRELFDAYFKLSLGIYLDN